MTATTEGSKKSAIGGKRTPNRLSPTTVEKYIGGAHFPAYKDELVELAQQNNAPKDVMDLLNQFYDQKYGSIIDVAREVGRIDASVQNGGHSDASNTKGRDDKNPRTKMERGDGAVKRTKKAVDK